MGRHTTRASETTRKRPAQYTVALVGDDRYRRVAAGSEPIDIGAELNFDGIRCEVIGHLWRVGTPETLLCRRLAAAPEGEPLPRERAWWSTEWH